MNSHLPDPPAALLDEGPSPIGVEHTATPPRLTGTPTASPDRTDRRMH